MGIKEQFRLLKHYQSLANNELKDRGNRDFKVIVRKNAKKHADEILKKYPGIEEKMAEILEAEKPKEEKPKKEKPKKKEEK